MIMELSVFGKFSLCTAMSNYRTYKEIKQTFPKERIEQINDGADKISKELNILNKIRQKARMTEEESTGFLEGKQLENNNNPEKK